MITVYYKKANYSSNKALEWLDKHAIEYRLCQIEHITKENIISVLSLTQNGINDIVKDHGDTGTRRKIFNLYNMTMNGALDFLFSHPEILKVPLIVSENKLMAGYNNEEIRKFIPRVKHYDV